MSSKLLKRYIRNYLGGLVILLALLIPIYLSIYGGTKERILIEKSNQLKSEVDELDSQIGKMQFITDMLRSNEKVSKIVEIKEAAKAGDSVTLNKARSFMTDCLLLGASDMFEGECLMFRDNNVVLGTSEILSHSVYHDYSMLMLNGMNFEMLQRMIFEDDRIIQYISCTDELDAGIVCVMKAPINRLNAFDMAFVFKINERMLNQILGMSNNSEADFAYVTGVNGEILFQVNYVGEPIQRMENGDAITLNGQRYNLIQLSSEVCGLSWTIGISNATINGEIANVNRIIWIYIIASIFIMVLICVFWALRRSKSMTPIFEKLKIGEEVVLPMGSEYQYLASGVNRLKHENELYKTKVVELSQSVIHSMLEKLLFSGIYSNKEKEEVLRYLEWDMKFYCVVCVNVEALEPDEQLFDYFYKIDDAFYKRFECLSINTARDERVYIIKMNRIDIQENSVVLNALQGIVSEFEEARVGVSAIGTELENVQLFYRQAKLMVRQVTGLSDIRIKEYKEFCDNKNRIDRLNIGNQIYDLIYAQEKKGLEKVFEKIKEHVIKNVWKTEQEVMRFFFEIQNPIFRVWNEIGLTDTEKELPIYRSDRKILALINDLEAAACYLSDVISENEKNRKSELRDEMIDFADSHYCEKEMCIAYAADHFKLSEKRFSAIFKELTGEKFSVYIENRRFQQAEKYLCETDWGMNKIADAIGYNSLDAFYKSFKKRYGLAPGKWKERKLIEKERKTEL